MKTQLQHIFFISALTLAAFFFIARPVAAATDKTVGSYNTAGTAYDVTVVDNYAYVVDGDDGVIILNITDPTNPTLAGSYNTPGTAKRVEASGSNLYVADTTALVILDISAQTVPTLAGTWTGTATAVNDVTLDGTKAYVLGQTGGTTKLFVVDVTNPAAPSELGSYTGAGNDVVLSGNYVYLAGGSNFEVINKYPTLTQVGQTSYAGGGFGGLQVVGSYAYLNDMSDGLVVIDVANPAQPAAVVTSYPKVDLGEGAAISNGYVFLPSYLGNVYVYDITTGGSPVYVDAFSTPLLGRNIAIANTYAYVANDTSGLTILDMSKPDAVPPTITPVSDPGGTVTPDGDLVVTIPAGVKYTDPGATAGDNIDGTITSRITTTSNVDVNTVGTYTITYTVTDRGGNTTVTTRTVIVAAALKSITGPNGAFTITVGKKKVVVRPFGVYRGKILARRAIVKKFSQPVYIFLQTDPKSNPQMVVMNYKGKVLSRAILSGVSTRGFNTSIVADGVHVWLAIAPKTGGLRANIYTFSDKGLTLNSRMTVSSKPAKTVARFLKMYTTLGYQYGLVTFVSGNQKSVKIWKYSTAKKKFVADTTTKKSRITISGATATFK